MARRRRSLSITRPAWPNQFDVEPIGAYREKEAQRLQKLVSGAFRGKDLPPLPTMGKATGLGPAYSRGQRIARAFGQQPQPQQQDNGNPILGGIQQIGGGIADVVRGDVGGGLRNIGGGGLRALLGDNPGGQVQTALDTIQWPADAALGAVVGPLGELQQDPQTGALRRQYDAGTVARGVGRWLTPWNQIEQSNKEEAMYEQAGVDTRNPFAKLRADARGFQSNEDIPAGLRIGTSAALDPLTWVGPGAVSRLGLANRPGARFLGAVLENPLKPTLGGIGGAAAAAQWGEDVPGFNKIPESLQPLVGGVAGALSPAAAAKVARSRPRFTDLFDPEELPQASVTAAQRAKQEVLSDPSVEATPYRRAIDPERLRTNRFNNEKAKAKPVGPKVGQPIKTEEGLHFGRLKEPQEWVEETDRAFVAGVDDDELEMWRTWYSKGDEAFIDLYGQDEFERFRDAFMIANRRTSPEGALLNVTRAEDIRLGQKPIKLAGTRSMQEAIIEALEMRWGKGVQQKISDFLDSVRGKKTRSWQGDDPAGGQPFVADVWTMRDAGFIDGVTKDQFGLQIDDALLDTPRPKQAGQAASMKPTDLQYETAVNWGNQLANYLNDIQYRGHNDWTAPMVQAVGWGKMRKLYGLDPQSGTMAQAVKQSTRRISYEAAFGDGSPLASRYDFYSLEPQQQKQVTEEILEQITDFVLKTVPNVRVQNIIDRSGGYLDYPAAPSRQLEILASPEGAADVADALGYLLQQSEMLASRPLKSGGTIGVDVVLPEGMGEEAIEALWDALRARAPKLAVGYQPMNDGSRLGIRILDRDGVLKRKGAMEQLKRTLDDIEKDMGLGNGEIDYYDGNYEAVFTGNDWTANGDGNGYLSRLTERGRDDIVQRLVDWSASRDAIVEDAFARIGRGSAPDASFRDRLAGLAKGALSRGLEGESPAAGVVPRDTGQGAEARSTARLYGEDRPYMMGVAPRRERMRGGGSYEAGAATGNERVDWRNMALDEIAEVLEQPRERVLSLRNIVEMQRRGELTGAQLDMLSQVQKDLWREYRAKFGGAPRRAYRLGDRAERYDALNEDSAMRGQAPGTRTDTTARGMPASRAGNDIVYEAPHERAGKAVDDPSVETTNREQVEAMERGEIPPPRQRRIEGEKGNAGTVLRDSFTGSGVLRTPAGIAARGAAGYASARLEGEDNEDALERAILAAAPGAAGRAAARGSANAGRVLSAVEDTESTDDVLRQMVEERQAAGRNPLQGGMFDGLDIAPVQRELGINPAPEGLQNRMPEGEGSPTFNDPARESLQQAERDRLVAQGDRFAANRPAIDREGGNQSGLPSSQMSGALRGAPEFGSDSLNRAQARWRADEQERLASQRQRFEEHRVVDLSDDLTAVDQAIAGMKPDSTERKVMEAWRDLQRSIQGNAKEAKEGGNWVSKVLVEWPVAASRAAFTSATTGDPGSGLIQSIYLGATHPVEWVKSMKASFRAAFDPAFRERQRAFQRARLEDAVPAEWRDRIYDYVTEGREIVEEGKPPKRGPKLAITRAQRDAEGRLLMSGDLGSEALESSRLGPVGAWFRGGRRQFETQTEHIRMTALVDILERMRKVNRATGQGDILTLSQIDGAINTANHLTGASGIGAHPALAIALGAPRFFISQLQLLQDAVTKGGISGAYARREMVKSLGAMTTATVLANVMASGGKDWFGPGLGGPDDIESFEDFKRIVTSPNFGRVRVTLPGLGQSDVSLYGPLDTLARTFFREAMNLASAGDDNFVTPGTATVGMLEGKASPFVRIAANLLRGEDRFTGEEYSLDDPLEFVMREGPRAFPIFSQNILEAVQGEGSYANAVIGYSGLKASPLTPYEHAQATLQSLPGEYWVVDADNQDIRPPASVWELSPKQRSELRAEYPAIDRYLRQREEDPDRPFSSMLNTVFKDSQTQWDERLESGELTTDQWRTQFHANQNQIRLLREEMGGDEDFPADTQRAVDLNSYFAIYDMEEVQTPQGVDYDAFERQVQALESRIGAKRWAAIEETLGWSESPVVREYRADMNRYGTFLSTNPKYVNVPVEQTRRADAIANQVREVQASNPGVPSAYILQVWQREGRITAEEAIAARQAVGNKFSREYKAWRLTEEGQNALRWFKPIRTGTEDLPDSAAQVSSSSGGGSMRRSRNRRGRSSRRRSLVLS